VPGGRGSTRPVSQRAAWDVPGAHLTVGGALGEQVFDPSFGPLGYVAMSCVEQSREA
jgi:hypothetical protein